MIEVKNLYKTFTTVVAVNDVSFRVEPGRVFGLLGPNGAGKTTTIRMIINIIQADSGEIMFDGETFKPEMQNVIGYLPEERGLYRKNKLLPTIQYFTGLKGIDSAEAKRRVIPWLKRFDLLPYINNRIEELSKGNQQKVQFIVSVLHEPRYIILDEPFAGLDPVNQILLKDIIDELKREGRIIIFSTHQMEQAEKMCDDICIINKGRVVLNGPIHEVKKKFGRNSVHLRFSGNGDILKNILGVKKVSLYSNAAELELEERTSPTDILMAIGRQLEIQKFEVKEPTLNAIFLHLVGATVEEVERKEEQQSLVEVMQ